MTASLSLSKGVPWMGAQAENKQYGAPRTRSYLWNADLAYLHRRKLRGHLLQYRMLFHGQQSSSALYSADEISIGGLYTVRGFDGERSISGKSGWYMQNE